MRFLKKYWLLFVGATLLSIIYGCSTKLGGGSTTTPSINLSAGCGKTGQQTGTFHLSALDGHGTTRDYEVMVPAGYDPNTPLKLTLVYHGANATEATAVGFGVQTATGASAASIFVFPQGINYLTYGVGWDDTCSGYDMPFFDTMVANIENNYCVDTTKVFAAGFSWGGDHVTALACCRGSKVRAVAPASDSDEYANPANFMTYNNLPCPQQTNAAVRFTHDVASDGVYTAQEFTSQLYRYFNSCMSTSTATTPSPCVSYNSCNNPVVECAYTGLGHAIPAGWGTDTWNFFSSF